ncbi:MAG: hypothetical protein IIU03_08965, partial [Bacteroidales bacterium]|nr:hypothetical protein [Bacteroidales bacterium]
MRALFFIAAFLFLVACGEKPQPNRDLLSAYELLKKGELNAAKLLAEKSERKTEADDALFYIVRGAVAAATLERTYSDSIGIVKSILFFDGDKEKLAWAHLVLGEILYNSNYILPPHCLSIFSLPLREGRGGSSGVDGWVLYLFTVYPLHFS